MMSTTFFASIDIYLMVYGCIVYGAGTGGRGLGLGHQGFVQMPQVWVWE